MAHLRQLAQGGELALAGGLSDRLSAQKGEHVGGAQVEGVELLLQTPVAPEVVSLPIDAGAGRRALAQGRADQFVEVLQRFYARWFRDR